MGHNVEQIFSLNMIDHTLLQGERMAIIGNIAPDSWMKRATGEPVGAEALLEATRRALDAVAPSPN